MDAWYNNFITIFEKLGWREPSVPSDDQRPMSFPQSNERSSTDQVNGDRHSTPSVIENAFEDEVSWYMCCDQELW